MAYFGFSKNPSYNTQDRNYYREWNLPNPASIRGDFDITIFFLYFHIPIYVRKRR